ncbi:hypothetical protein JHK87_052629 [Glycine soja]|nr:hypothetical protein JHK87_052629 [Glycine soja]
MARIADKIKTIDGSKETLKLVVRITELWFVGTLGRSEQAEIVIVDFDDDYCVQFLEYLDHHESEGPIIVLLSNARIKEGQGSYPCSVSNSLKASKLTIHEPVAPIEEFNQKLSKLGIEIRSVLTHRSQWSSQPLGSAQLSSREAFISKSEAKSISEINNICEDGDLDLNASPKALDKLLEYFDLGD